MSDDRRECLVAGVTRHHLAKSKQGGRRNHCETFPPTGYLPPVETSHEQHIFAGNLRELYRCDMMPAKATSRIAINSAFHDAIDVCLAGKPGDVFLVTLPRSRLSTALTDRTSVLQRCVRRVIQ
ncbi:hypothetical protein [Rhizobium grahamii]|uniref:hypothetical protein n=1 Tax=Rhizobium grahamii TaxID=1120045 RepID=UPI001672EFC7|nr:hypothetical protein [Rhizobium grahamii]